MTKTSALDGFLAEEMQDPEFRALWEETSPQVSFGLALGSMREQLTELAAAVGRPAPGVALSIFVQVGEGPAAREEARRYLEGAYNVDFDRLERYCALGSVAEVVEKLAGLVEAGVEGFVLMPAVRDTLAQYEPLAEVAALLRAGL